MQETRPSSSLRAWAKDVQDIQASSNSHASHKASISCKDVLDGPEAAVSVLAAVQLQMRQSVPLSKDDVPPAADR